MLIKNKFFTYLTIAAMVTAGLVTTPSATFAITIQQEREMSKEFMEVVKRKFPLIDDPIIVDYVNRVGQRILGVIDPQPFDYEFHVLRVDVYNAFATPAGHIFFNSGLFAALESEEELAGIIGHEIAHVTCRHISQRIESQKKISMATMAGVLAGALLGAGGSAEAAGALTMGSMAAGQTAALAYSRENETQADQLGLEYLDKAGYSGAGLLRALKTIRSKQWYGSDQIPTYMTTHPASEERMSYIDNWMHQSRPRHKGPVKEVGGWELAHTRLIALYTDPQVAQQRFADRLSKAPGDDMAHYGYALALTRSDQWSQAARHMRKAIEANALAAHMLHDLGRIYFHQGKFDQALKALSAGRSEKSRQTQLYLGRTQMALGDMQAARDTFDQLVRFNEEYLQAYYFLGESSGRLGDMFTAHYSLGRYYSLKGDRKNAAFHLNRAGKLAGTKRQKEMVQSQLKDLPPAPPVSRKRRG